MPRLARFVLANCPHHLIQRGHNRQTVFTERVQYSYYLDTLREWKERLGCQVHAYCLMPNHVHLVINPGDRPESLGLLMKRLAGRLTRYVNVRDKRSGSLWEGRYKSSPVESSAYLLACCRYVELNPVRAGMVAQPEEYPWSSCPAKVGHISQPWLDLDPLYLNLGSSAGQRATHYAAWLREAVAESEWALIREAIQRGQLTARKSFAEELSQRVGREFILRGPGRPRKQQK